MSPEYTVRFLLNSELHQRVDLIFCKAVPAICHGGTRGERRYSSCSYVTSALDGGLSGQRHAPAALYPFRYPLDKRLGGPQSRSGRRG
jgi:hypothetical protein